MNDDIVARLRLYSHRMKETRSSVLGLLLRDAANEIEWLQKELNTRIAMCDIRSEKIIELTNERDEARLQTGQILNEIDCRVEHGADSNGHLEAILKLFSNKEF